jgi:hypothetical protein
MRLQRDEVFRKFTRGNAHAEGKFYIDVGLGFDSGWAVKTWSQPNEPIYLPSDSNWIDSKTLKIYRMRFTINGRPEIHKEDVDILSDRKELLLAAVTEWERVQYD